LRAALDGLALGPVRYFASIGSTNTEAAGWADAGAPDLALAAADEQTAGRGRSGRRWFTPPGAALAFSLVLRPPFPCEMDIPSLMARLTALGALAVTGALQQRYGLPAQIKWPNDVLVHGRKLCGILAEAHWLGMQLSAVILGIGVNVAQRAAPPDEQVIFPAASVEHMTGPLSDPDERWKLLHDILEHFLHWKAQMTQPAFMQAWEGRLAFKGEWVWMVEGAAAGEKGQESEIPGNAMEARIIGLEGNGGLCVEDRQGARRTVTTGEVRLRPKGEGYAG
jgi:BirA family biotin operon repressor/biotin-[acetyl-CoA-carboxylase] ligase